MSHTGKRQGFFKGFIRIQVFIFILKASKVLGRGVFRGGYWGSAQLLLKSMFSRVFLDPNWG